jgi:hypothetical protein
MYEMRSLAASLVVVAALGAGSVAAQSTVKTAPGASHISGGSSAESREEMKQQAGQFNVRATFITKSGAYMADVDVVVTDAAGKAVLTTRTEGPWLYARLAPGSYEMRATANSVTQKQKFAVQAQGPRQLTFRWEGEP